MPLKLRQASPKAGHFRYALNARRVPQLNLSYRTTAPRSEKSVERRFVRCHSQSVEIFTKFFCFEFQSLQGRLPVDIELSVHWLARRSGTRSSPPANRGAPATPHDSGDDRQKDQNADDMEGKKERRVKEMMHDPAPCGETGTKKGAARSAAPSSLLNFSSPSRDCCSLRDVRAARP